jgi:hypothetical protein
MEGRNALISWGTVIVFAVAVLTALAVFGRRYADSRVHGWNDVNPLGAEFLTSRLVAHQLGCIHQPCFTVGPRLESIGNPLPGVNEYILYLTDGGLVAIGFAVVLGFAYMLFIGCHRPFRTPFEL